jgi:hypothetical protein
MFGWVFQRHSRPLDGTRVLDFTATFVAYDDWGTGTVEQTVVGSVALDTTRPE